MLQQSSAHYRRQFSSQDVINARFHPLITITTPTVADSPLFASRRGRTRSSAKSEPKSKSLHQQRRRYKMVAACMIGFLSSTIMKPIRPAMANFEQTAVADTATVAVVATNRVTMPVAVLNACKSKLAKTSTPKLVGTFMALALLSSMIISTIKSRRRQAIDATSEWGRYAKRPAARGRAVGVLMMEQLCLIVSSKLCQLLQMKSRCDAVRLHAGRCFADSLLRLGPLYIKLGQIMSCQKNLLGDEWMVAMEKLQDRVPARTGQDALDLAYLSLEDGIDEFEMLFSEFDTKPLAAASLGQVHRAVLRKSGDEVAVKIQRPYLKEIYDKDFVFLTTIAKYMDKIPSAQRNMGGGVNSSWTTIFEDAEEILYREINYRDEAANGVRFCQDFGLGKGGKPISSAAQSRNGQLLPSAADWLRAPFVYSEISSERMLIMEYVPSIKITDEEKLNDEGISLAQREQLADSLARAYLRQFCCNLFFSTDPHPGNLGVEFVLQPDGSREPRLVLYDFGQAASLSRDQADGILEIIKAIIDTDVDRSMDAFQKMGVLSENADLDKVRAKIADNYKTGKIKANRKKLKRRGYKFKEDSATTNGATNGAQDLSLESDNEYGNSKKLRRSKQKSTVSNDMEVMSYFKLPAEYAFVARAISQMSGVGKTLDPDFDFISNAAPYIVEIQGADKYVQEEVQKAFRGVQENVKKLQFKLLGLTSNNRRGENRLGGKISI